ncbi:MAG: response regulator [Candidatus Flexifilum sp.]|jgi:DNA-binding NarL/FixJ family response regulator
MTRLLLAEDHILVRQSIRAFLESAGLDVIGETGDGAEAVRLARELQPDVVLLDLRLPGLSGIEAARHIRQQCPSIRLVILTAYDDRAYQRALAEIGVDAFVLKTAELSELLTVIRRVLVADQGLASLSSAADSQMLTEREREVLQCAARGWTNKQIGAYLCISDRTVQVHLQAIYHKLGVNGRVEAVLRGLKLNLIQQIDQQEGHD